MSVFLDIITNRSSWAISKEERPVYIWHMYIVPRIGVMIYRKQLLI